MNKEARNHILTLIPKGKNNAISMKYLAAMLHVNERETRKIITDLRMSGFVVIGDQSGYYLPTTKDEIRTYYRTVLARQRTTDLSLAAVRHKLKTDNDSFRSEYEQISLFDINRERG